MSAAGLLMSQDWLTLANLLVWDTVLHTFSRLKQHTLTQRSSTVRVAFHRQLVALVITLVGTCHCINRRCASLDQWYESRSRIQPLQ